MAALARADRRWAQREADEPASPAYLAHLEQYLRPLAGEPSNGDGAASKVDAGELNDVRARLKATERDLASRTAEHDQLAGELQTARTDLARSREQLSSAESELELARDERARLVDELRDARQRRTGDERAVSNVLGEVERHRSTVATLRHKLKLATERLEQADQHVHFYEWPDPAEPPLPCSCGAPYPRLRLAEDYEEIEPDVHPWDDVWAGLRVDLAGWGSPAPKRRRSGRGGATS